MKLQLVSYSRPLLARFLLYFQQVKAQFIFPSILHGQTSKGRYSSQRHSINNTFELTFFQRSGLTHPCFTPQG